MGLINRLKRITLGRIEAFLDSVQRPEIILPEIVKEMQSRLKQIANAEAKSLAAVRSAQRKCDEAEGRAGRLQRGASLAIKAGQEDLARQALAAQIEAEREAESCRRSVQQAEKAYEASRQMRERFQRDLEYLKRKKREILARSRVVKARADALQDMEPGTGSVLDSVARMEEKVALQEDQVSAHDELSTLLRAGLGEGLSDADLRNAEVEARLNELRKQLADEQD